MRELFKTIILLFLVILAIFQTGELWFSNMGRNFFDVFAQTPNIVSYSKQFIRPIRALTSLGNNRFAATYAPNYYYIVQIKPALEAALYNGTYTTLQLNASVFNQRGVIYYYSFNMPTFEFLHILGISNYYLQGILPTFNKLLIVPIDSTVNIYFIGDVIVNLSVENSAVATQINTQIQDTHRQRINDDIHYISTDLIGFTLSENIFVPHWRGSRLAYHPLIAQPFLKNNEGKSLATIGESLNLFFANPSLVWSDERDNIFTFSDFNVVVRYNSNAGIIEYINHRQGTGQIGLLADFYNAITFIDRDVSITNEVILSHFKQGYYYTTFYFDYVVNNFPVFLESSSLSSFIEVTVQNGGVVHYTRISANFQISDEINYHQEDIINLVDTYGQSILPRFGYIFTGDDEVMLDWDN